LGVPEREQPKQGNLFWCNSPGELELARASCSVTDPSVLGVPGYGGRSKWFQTDSFDVIKCI